MHIALIRHARQCVVFAVLCAAWLPSGAAAQSILGTFRWQFAPYCNVVTLLVEQKGPVFELAGTDDGCDGAAPAAIVKGVAHINAGGTVGIGLSILRPDAMVVNATIQLNPATLSGTWKDDWANIGTFTFNPALPAGGSPRRLTMRGDWTVTYPATSSQSQGQTQIAFAHTLPSAPGAARSNIIPAGSVQTANCPGTITNPQAAPGQLCLYEGPYSNVNLNASTILMFSAGNSTNDEASPDGFIIFVNAVGAGHVSRYGRWAATVP